MKEGRNLKGVICALVSRMSREHLPAGLVMSDSETSTRKSPKTKPVTLTQ